MFSSLQKGSTVYVLCKEDKPKLYVAQVVERTEPTANFNAPRPMYGQPAPSTMKLVAMSGDTRFEFSELDANAKIVPYKGNSIIAVSREDMGAEWDRIVGNSRQALDSVSYHQGIIDADDEIRAVLYPQFAKDKANEQKIVSLEQKIGGIEKTLSTMHSEFREMFSSALNGGVTSGVSRKKE